MHFPFCSQKCSYCDFYSTTQSFLGYGKLLIKELQLKQKWFETLQFNTLYFGGGTPSLMPLNELEEFLSFLNTLYPIEKLQEITLEVNPETLTLQKAKALKDLGINRLSLGIQSFNPEILKKIGRQASLKQNIKALEITPLVFNNFSVDFIYGIKNQKIELELENLKALHPPHISAYALTLDSQVPLAKKKEDLLPSDKKVNEDFYLIHSFLKNQGYQHYEISNYGKESFFSAHNLHYWKGHFYLGLGAGASGYVKKERYINNTLLDYQKNLLNNKDPVLEKDFLTNKDLQIETFLLGLRLQEGVQVPFLKENPLLLDLVKEFEEQGLLIVAEEKLKPTLKGWTLLDHMLKNIYFLL